MLRVLAALCAAEKTEEKKPPELVDVFVVEFSGVGVSGAEVLVESLLGPNEIEFVLARLCDIMFPEGDVMMVPVELALD